MLAGVHVSASGGLCAAARRGADLGCEAIQVFTQSPRMWRTTRHDPADLAAYPETSRALGIVATVAHAIYFINLASSDEEIYAKSRAALGHSIDTINAIEGDAVIFHLGSHLGKGLDSTLPQIRFALAEALDRLGEDTWLCLESSAGQGGTIGRSVEELAGIVALMDHPRLGICLDTCHLYVSGVDVRDPDVVDALVEEVASSIGLDRLRCLHVNDSAAPLGSNRDRHANLGEGEIGPAIGLLLSHPALADLPAILETPGPEGKGSDAAEVALLKAYHAAGVAARSAR